jgi:peptidoglycan hydrolase-like protein with peptidoglycan-binding domain
METNPKNPKKYNIEKINGEYNEKTKNAIKQFQTDCKLTWKDGKP